MIPDAWSFYVRFSYWSEESICTQGAIDREWTSTDELQLSTVIILGMSQPVQGSHRSFTATHDIMLSISADRGGNSCLTEIRWLSATGGRTDLGPESHSHQPCLPLPWKLVNMDRWVGWRGSRVMQTMYLLCVDWGRPGRRHGAMYDWWKMPHLKSNNFISEIKLNNFIWVSLVFL